MNLFLPGLSNSVTSVRMAFIKQHKGADGPRFSRVRSIQFGAARRPHVLELPAYWRHHELVSQCDRMPRAIPGHIDCRHRLFATTQGLQIQQRPGDRAKTGFPRIATTGSLYVEPRFLFLAVWHLISFRISSTDTH